LEWFLKNQSQNVPGKGRFRASRVLDQVTREPTGAFPNNIGAHAFDRQCLPLPEEFSHGGWMARKARKAPKRRWSAAVTRESDALDLRQGVFKLKDPKRIAASLKRSAERSHRRKSSAYRSALSMLTFYINRAGKNLPPSRRKILDRAKEEVRAKFGKPSRPPVSARSSARKKTASARTRRRA
jgi:hypothetical protein